MSSPTPSLLLLLEAFDLISCTTVPGVVYGVTFMLFCLCARLLYLELQVPARRKEARFNLFNLGFISVQLCFATIYVALNARTIQLAYIDHADFPGGPVAYELLANVPYVVAAGIFNLPLQTLKIAIQVSS